MAVPAGVLWGAWPSAGDQNTAQSDTSQVNSVVTPKHKVGAFAPDKNGGLWVYVNCTAAVTGGDWVTYDEAGVAADAAANGVGRVGVMGGAVAANDYGWAQVLGSNTHAAQTGGDTTAEIDRACYVSGTAGQVQADTVAGDLVVGAVFRSAGNTSDTAIPEYSDVDLNWPFITNILG